MGAESKLKVFAEVEGKKKSNEGYLELLTSDVSLFD